MNSRDDNQLRGVDVPLATLESNCGNTTKEDGLILNPCGSVANSLFNDVFTLHDSDYVLNEHDISWKYDREKFNNPSNYGDPNYKWLSLFVYSCDIVATSPIPM